MSESATNNNPPQMLLPHWMYSQIVSDPSPKAVWCFCGAPAVTYCNGLQFVCHGGGHFGVPMKALKPRPEEQVFLEEQCTKGRERLREQYEQEEAKRAKRSEIRTSTIEHESAREGLGMRGY